MPDEVKDPVQDPGKGTPGEAVIEIEAGNTFNKQQIIDLRNTKVSLEKDLGDVRGVLTTAQADLEKSKNEFSTLNIAKLQGLNELDSARAKIKELEGVTQTYISPDKYKAIQDEVEGHKWESLVTKVDFLNKTFGVEVGKLHGKSLGELGLMQEGLELGGAKSKPAVLNTKGDATSSPDWQSSIEQNKLKIAELRSKKGKVRSD